MLLLKDKLLNRPIMSLRSGGAIGTALDIIINPNNLKIEGWHCQDRFERKKHLVLQVGEVRDVIAQGIVVNDHDSLSEPQDLVRLQKILKYSFELLGKPVVTQSGKRIGKVSDYAVDSNSLFVEKLYVTQSFLKSLNDTSRSIDRSQIVEITNRKIVVNDPTITEEAPATAPVLA